ncbi:MAG: hypothetical protein JO078_02230 [Candidatus Eremiobacteraeota bacterium]|nr:hypothetical protein [Candidatus Eremiobacteraeota bacterium]MBV9055687.1 hypothetical protein [Candidatus Eremiobacteraeota bacterium]MBV9698921.1 hypothetical protein [Candidatus Eremiobacteraeota bacterium]
MRIALYATAAAGLASLGSAEILRGALASSASALTEATPFVFAAVALEVVARPARWLLAYAGCGCSHGPSARSIPAAAATWLAFGPIVAVARFAGGVIVAAFLRPRVRHCGTRVATPQALNEIAALVPAAVLAAALMQLFAHLGNAALGVGPSVAFGAALGISGPCALGTVALAGALRAHAPAAMTAFLCIAGILDVRALRPHHSRTRHEHDGFAYGLLGSALASVGARHGAALVHPAFCAPLDLCAIAAFACCVIFRRRRCPGARVAPALMLSGALIGAPPPAYQATETTLSDAFPGEQLRFAGTLTCDHKSCALVRYAITCCRADATPLVIAISGVSPRLAGSWLRVDGTIESVRHDLALVPRSVERISPPGDPFIYR